MKNSKKSFDKFLYIIFFIFLPIIIGVAFPIFNIKFNNIQIFFIILDIIIIIFLIKSNLDKNTIISTIMIVSMITLSKIYIILLIGWLISLIKSKSYIFMYLFTIIITCLGMLFRYIIEYGEISNKRDFTIINILTTLIFIPILSIIIVKIIDKFYKS